MVTTGAVRRWLPCRGDYSVTSSTIVIWWLYGKMWPTRRGVYRIPSGLDRYRSQWSGGSGENTGTGRW